MKIHKLTDRDRVMLQDIMEIVAAEMSSATYKTDILYNIKNRVSKRWEGADRDAVFAAMERGWDEGLGWNSVGRKR